MVHRRWRERRHACALIALLLHFIEWTSFCTFQRLPGPRGGAFGVTWPCLSRPACVVKPTREAAQINLIWVACPCCFGRVPSGTLSGAFGGHAGLACHMLLPFYRPKGLMSFCIVFLELTFSSIKHVQDLRVVLVMR